jgi:hypothetical protein
MNSDFFSPAHSCDFCRKLILYKRDSIWWSKALNSTSEDPENVGPALSVRVKDWLTKQLKRIEGEPKHADRLLNDLHHIVIFDCTIAEARDGAAGGCSLCENIIQSCYLPADEPEDATFLAADIGHGVLGVIQTGTDSYFGQSKGDEDVGPIFRVERSRELRAFKMVALPSKYDVFEKRDIRLLMF